MCRQQHRRYHSGSYPGLTAITSTGSNHLSVVVSLDRMSQKGRLVAGPGYPSLHCLSLLLLFCSCYYHHLAFLAAVIIINTVVAHLFVGVTVGRILPNDNLSSGYSARSRRYE